MLGLRYVRKKNESNVNDLASVAICQQIVAMKIEAERKFSHVSPSINELKHIYEI